MVLEDGPELRCDPIGGAQRLLVLDDDHYVQRLDASAQRPSRVDMFTQRSRIAAQVDMARLVRPRVDSAFAASVGLALARITELGLAE